MFDWALSVELQCMPISRFMLHLETRHSLPASLRVLAEDHKGDAVTWTFRSDFSWLSFSSLSYVVSATEASKMQRPLSPQRKPRSSVISGARRLSGAESDDG